MHKYNFYGEIRTYRNKLTLIDESVVYMGVTDELINHWNVKPNKISLLGRHIPKSYTLDDFLEDTQHYEKPISEIIPEKLKVIGNKNVTHSKKEALYSYRVDGEIRYYNTQKDRNDFDLAHCKSVEYLGIKYGTPKTKVTPTPKARYLNKYCCYCEQKLNYKNYTREHVIPAHRGGKIIRPCCQECNWEKGGLMLHSYIQMLNLKLLEASGPELIKLQTKSSNANKLAREINL